MAQSSKKHRFSSQKVIIFVPSMHKTCIIRNLGALGCRSRQVYQLLFQTTSSPQTAVYGYFSQIIKDDHRCGSVLARIWKTAAQNTDRIQQAETITATFAMSNKKRPFPGANRDQRSLVVSYFSSRRLASSMTRCFACARAWTASSILS